jgi:hypothetical protein
VLLLSGCQNLPKAEPYYTETREDVTFNTQYSYCFEDERDIRCIWKNESTEGFSFHDTFELHVLGNDGEWYLLSKGDEVSFNTNYRHGIDPESETSSRYDLSLYTDEIENGKTYRISTYFFDDTATNSRFLQNSPATISLPNRKWKKSPVPLTVKIPNIPMISIS